MTPGEYEAMQAVRKARSEAQLTLPIEPVRSKPRTQPFAKKAPSPVHPKLTALMQPRGKTRKPQTQPYGKVTEASRRAIRARFEPVTTVDPVDVLAIAEGEATGEAALDVLGQAIMPVHTRESWMLSAIHLLTPLFEEADLVVPPVRVSFGWPGGRGKKKGVIGQCFPGSMVKDGQPAIFISPVRMEPVDVLETLTHELVHACLGRDRSDHRGSFAKAAAKVGLAAPWTATAWADDEATTQRVNDLLVQLGPLDHASIASSGTQRIQTTRMLKVECGECGCVLRMTQKWVDESGLPTCGCGGEMARA